MYLWYIYFRTELDMSIRDVYQVEGGFVQSVGLYTIEELQFSPNGVLMTRGPSQYKVPAELNVHLLANAENRHAIYLSKVPWAFHLKTHRLKTSVQQH